MKLNKFLFFLFLLFVFQVNAQIFNDSLVRSYPFVAYSKNEIKNDSIGLANFYNSLQELEQFKTKKIRIVHIGDSHIQADIFSGKMRERLQKQFGNSGRGLLFPYKVAKTNEPYSFQTSSGGTWRSRRNVIAKDSIPIGICGITLRTDDTTAFLKIKLSNTLGLNYATNTITIFHDKQLDAYGISCLDNNYCELKALDLISDKNGISSISVSDKMLTEFYIKPKVTDPSKQKYAHIFGIFAENDSAGISYSAVGVNGAEYRHYNKSIYFQDQLTFLNSDLIIVSLGTNECNNVKFSATEFYAQIDTFITAIKLHNPNASILLTSPGDFLRKRKIKNPTVSIANKTIQEYCLKNNLAYWDFYTIMGGYSSILKWYKAGLSSKDKIHLNKKGYELQGELLYRALINGYNHFKTYRTK